MRLGLVTVVVDDYDSALEFFVDRLGFVLAEDSPAVTTGGRAKRWVVVQPPGGGAGVLLARADGDDQIGVVGRQVAGRVGFFLDVDDVDAQYAALRSRGVVFIGPPRTERYGRVAVIRDVAGNRWDLRGPAPSPVTPADRPWNRVGADVRAQQAESAQTCVRRTPRSARPRRVGGPAAHIYADSAGLHRTFAPTRRVGRVSRSRPWCRGRSSPASSGRRCCGRPRSR